MIIFIVNNKSAANYPGMQRIGSHSRPDKLAVIDGRLAEWTDDPALPLATEGN